MISQAFVPAPRPAIPGRTGIRVPSDWGRFWKPKLAAAGTAKATVAVVGESISYGGYSSNLDTKSWPGLLKVALQARGNGGTGYLSSARAPAMWDSMTGVTSAHRTAWASQSFAATSPGAGWAIFPNFGPGGHFLSTGLIGATLSCTVVGTTIKIFSVTGSGNGTFTYSIDGAAAVTVSTNAAQAVQITTVTGLSAGSHTVLITTTSANVAISGVSAENATGVIVNNFSVPGAKATTYTGGTTLMPAPWCGGANYPADLVIYELAANDCNTSVTVDTWSKNVRLYLDEVRDETSGAVDLMFVMPHIQTFDQGGLALYQDYCARARMLADVYGAALVDVWSLLRNSRVYALSLNFFGGGAAAGGVGTDIHPSDVGHQIMADAILPIVVSA